MATEQLMLAVPLKPVERGEEFAKFPPHITLAPWFDIEPDRFEELDEFLTETFETARRPITYLGDDVLFGDNNDIPANTLVATREYNLITYFPVYAAIHQAVNRIGQGTDPKYSGLEYTAHTSRSGMQKGERIVFTDPILVQKVAVSSIKRVIATYAWRTPYDQTTS